MLRAFLLSLLVLTGAGAARAEVVADISKHLVAISAGFTGTNLLLFGATDENAKVVVIVRGPEEPVTVRRKGRVAGVWMNQDAVSFETVPSYYAILTSHPLDEIVDEATSIVHEIGFNHLIMRPEKGIDRKEALQFQQALIRAKRNKELFLIGEGDVEIIRDKLFRTDVHLPANAPVGTYGVRVFLFDNSNIISAQSTVLDVGKVGITANIYKVAHQYSLVYGFLAVLIAVAAGWIASVVFRKR